MKVFNGREAADEYMSAHTLTFSTPDLTLKRFSFWLGDMVPDPNNKEEVVPRIMTFVEEKDFAPTQVIDDDKYVPSGAVLQSGLYGSTSNDTNEDVRFCSECGKKLSQTTKFCPECGSNQE